MRAALFVAILMGAACGGKSTAPSNTTTTARPDPTAKPTPGEGDPRSGEKPTPADCRRVVDHVYGVILADPALTDEQRAKVKEQRPMAEEPMLRQCADEFTRADVDCYVSKPTFVEMLKVCEKKQHHDMK